MKRYNNLSTQCQSVSALQDLTNFVRMLPLSPNSQKVPRKVFAPPQPPGPGDASADNSSEYNVSEIFLFSNNLLEEKCTETKIYSTGSSSFVEERAGIRKTFISAITSSHGIVET